MPSTPNSSHHQLEEVSFLPSDVLRRWFKQIHKHWTISRIIGIFSSDLFSGAHHHRFIHHTNTTTSPMTTNPTGKKAQGGFVLFCTLFQLKRRLHVRRQWGQEIAGNGIYHPIYKVLSLRFFIEFDDLMIQIYDFDIDYLDEAVNPPNCEEKEISSKRICALGFNKRSSSYGYINFHHYSMILTHTITPSFKFQITTGILQYPSLRGFFIESSMIW